jgi:menaquinone-dependent protoporphyrinogen oxidase
MPRRVLVAYASKNGSTGEIAAAIASAIRAHGLETDLLPAGEVDGDLRRYDAVVLGSAVYMKRWRREAGRVLRRHARELADVPFWVFSSGPVGESTDLSWCEPPRVVERVERLGAREHVVFGGRVPVDPKNVVERAMKRGTPPEFADRRDWAVIRRWADDIATTLGDGPAEEPQDAAADAPKVTAP